MKKNLISATIFSFLCLFLSLSTLSLASDISVDGFIQALENATYKKISTNEQINFLNSVNFLLQSSKFQSSEYKSLFDQLSNYASSKIQSLSISDTQSLSSTTAISPTSISVSYLDLPAVNLEKIRNTILSWHNQERNLLWLPWYIYQSQLERSANVWSDVLKSEERTVNTHIRKPSDGYYNYNSMSERFRNLDISFWSDWSFSESVGRGYYKCDKTDCTDELLKSLKTTRDFFMSEKDRNWVHYKAISSKVFSQIGIGISVDTSKKRYYFVLHYWTPISN